MITHEKREKVRPYTSDELTAKIEEIQALVVKVGEWMGLTYVTFSADDVTDEERKKFWDSMWPESLELYGSLNKCLTELLRYWM